jgi:hypothetical protein
MAKEISYDAELKLLQKYIESDENEDAKRSLLFPLFTKLFKDKFTSESATGTFGADGYVEGRLIIEAKSSHTQWLEGFYQALHYKQKYGLSFTTIMVIAHNFVAVWKIKKLPEFAVILANTVEANAAPSAIGKLNASKTQSANKLLIKEAAQYWLDPKDLKGELFKDKKSLITETYAIRDLLLILLKDPESSRIPTTIHNFITRIEEMKYYFEEPIDAIHAFYSIIPYWDDTSVASLQGTNENLIVSGFSGTKSSDIIEVVPSKKQKFKDFINKYFIHTNNGSGLTVDYYFSRFDEVLAVLDPEYVKQHGIFFTDDNLSKFALWFAKQEVTETIHDNFIVFDPAGGSGNLISSYKGKIRQKIISELQPDLLNIIEKRMKADLWHSKIDVTIIPKTGSNEGLNFLDKNGSDYYEVLEKAVLESTKKEITKPLAFLLNPPYKNTDEKETAREEKDAEYEIHPDILALTGADAGKERYLAFLGQILNICKAQAEKLPNAKPLVMIFTPTSWLIPRPTYKGFREIWDNHFEYKSGFITTSNEFFKLKGKWPLAFTIWQYNPSPSGWDGLGRENKIKILDLSLAKKQDLAYEWADTEEVLNPVVKEFLLPFKYINFDNNRGDIRDLLPDIDRKGKIIRQTRYDFSHSIKQHFKEIESGFPLKNKERHFNLLRKCGEKDGTFVGFMDDITPVRIYQEPSKRFTNDTDRVWFALMPTFLNINSTKILSKTPDKYGYCAYNISSAQATFTWFAIAKSLVGKYPTWANQYDLWQPNISKKLQNDWYALCYAFGLAENRCVVTKFEKDNPIAAAPEIWVDNPMSPNNLDSFYCAVLQNEIKKSNTIAKDLTAAIEDFYQYWNMNYTKGKILENVGLQDEPYFKYFDYPDFVTKNSGLIQIKKYAEVNQCVDLIEKMTNILTLTKNVRDAIYTMLVDDFKYFE